MEDIMAGSISVRIEWKSIAKATGQTRHDLRLKIPSYVDKSRTGENSILIKPLAGDELYLTCKKLREQRQSKRALKKNINVAVAGILTFSSDALKTIDTLDKSKQDELIMSAVKRISDTYDVDLSGLVVHRDEASIHCHFQFVGYNKQGYPLSNTIKLGDFSKLQDIAAEAFKEYNIGRGKPKKQRIQDGDDYSKTIHRSVRQLHEDLPAEIQKKQEQKAEIEKQIAEQHAKLEKNQRLIAQNEQKLAEGNLELEKINKINKNIEIYQKREADAKAKIEKLEAILNNENPPAMPKPEFVKVRTGYFKSQEKEIVEAKDLKRYTDRLIVFAGSKLNETNKKKEAELQEKEKELQEREKELADNIKIAKDYNKNYENLKKELAEKNELLQDTAKKILETAGIDTKNIYLEPSRATEIIKNYVINGLSAVKEFWQKLQNVLSR